MNLILLTIFILLLLIVNIKITKSFFSPSSMFAESYFLACICAMVNFKKWNFNDIHLNTLFIILTSLLLFSIISNSLIKAFVKKKSEDINIQYINIRYENIFILNLLSIIIFTSYLFFFLKAFGSFSSIIEYSKLMEIYRYKTVSENLSFIPSIINLLIKYCRALAYFWGYIIINNYFYNKVHNNKNNKCKLFQYLLGIIIFLPSPLLTGGRFDLIIFFIYLLLLWYFYSIRVYQKNINFKNLFKIAIIVIGIIFIFSTTRSLVGRQDNNGILEYTTTYFGGSIIIFDNYIQNYHYSSVPFGQETFAGIRKLLSQFHIIQNQSISLSIDDFFTINNITIGNVYTGLRKPIHDFGYFGLIILLSLQAIIFSAIYIKTFSKNDKSLNLNLLLYSILSYSLLLHSYSESFYSGILSFNYLMFIFFILLSAFIALKVRFK